MRGFSRWVIAMLIVAVACRRQASVEVPEEPSASSYLSITHASPLAGNLFCYIDNAPLKFADSLRYANTTLYSSLLNPYIPLPMGNRQIELTSQLSGVAPVSFNDYFEKGESYSLFVLDTMRYGRLRYMLLKDNVRPGLRPGNAGIRFLNLSPSAPALDLVIVPWGKTDTLLISKNAVFPSINYNYHFYDEKFHEIKGGIYWMEARLAGTKIPYLTGATKFSENVYLTIYVRGLVNGTGENGIGVGFIKFSPQ